MRAKTGAYHFFRFNRGGVEQALNLGVVSGRRLELGIAVDVEEHGNPRTDTDSVLQRLQTMTEYLNLRGYRVTFYTNKDGYAKIPFRNISADSRCGYALLPMIRLAMTGHSGNMTTMRRSRGIQGDVDMNAFCGSREQWDFIMAPSGAGVAYPSSRPEK